MSDLPSIDEVRELLSAHWRIEPRYVSAWPKSARLFLVEGHGFARVGFPRGGLTAAQLVEMVDTLHSTGCAVPAIVPTSTGELSVALEEASLSLERVVPGNECSASNLEILPQVGREIGRIHAATYENEPVPGCVSTLGEWIDQTLEKAQSWATEWDHGDEVRNFRSTIDMTHRDMKARFGLTHGDPRSPNVLASGDILGFVDFNCTFEPQLSDVVKIRNKWLMNGEVEHERPLTSAEIATVLRGYHETGPLTEEEIESFPVIWAVEQSWRLAQDLRIVSMFPEDRAVNWPISQQMVDLPKAMDFGGNIVEAALNLCDA